MWQPVFQNKMQYQEKFRHAGGLGAILEAKILSFAKMSLSHEIPSLSALLLFIYYQC